MIDKAKEIMRGIEFSDIYDEVHGQGCAVMVITEWGWYECPSISLLAEHHGIDADIINHKLETTGRWESPGMKVVLSKKFGDGSLRDMLPVGFEYRSANFV